MATKVLTGQEYKMKVENTKAGKLVLNDFTGDIPIEGYAGNEIVITATSEKFAKIPERFPCHSVLHLYHLPIFFIYQSYIWYCTTYRSSI